MNKVINDLEALLQVSPTAERYSLLGSTFKRKSILSSTKPLKIKALSEAALYYQKANSLSSSAYTITNRFEIESILVLAGNRTWGQSVKSGRQSYQLPTFEQVIDNLNASANELTNAADGDMNYWNMVALANIKLCLAILNSSASKTKMQWDDVLSQFRATWAKAGSKGKRIAEIEHLELLIDGLSLSRKPNVNSLRKNIEELKEELKKMI